MFTTSCALVYIHASLGFRISEYSNNTDTGLLHPGSLVPELLLVSLTLILAILKEIESLLQVREIQKFLPEISFIYSVV